MKLSWWDKSRPTRKVAQKQEQEDEDILRGHFRILFSDGGVIPNRWITCNILMLVRESVSSPFIRPTITEVDIFNQEHMLKLIHLDPPRFSVPFWKNVLLWIGGMPYCTGSDVLMIIEDNKIIYNRKTY